VLAFGVPGSVSPKASWSTGLETFKIALSGDLSLGGSQPHKGSSSMPNYEAVPTSQVQRPSAPWSDSRLGQIRQGLVVGVLRVKRGEVRVGGRVLRLKLGRLERCGIALADGVPANRGREYRQVALLASTQLGQDGVRIKLAVQGAKGRRDFRRRQGVEELYDVDDGAGRLFAELQAAAIVAVRRRTCAWRARRTFTITLLIDLRQDFGRLEQRECSFRSPESSCGDRLRKPPRHLYDVS
jgi:hypothetical protein